jgi:hypothetical protein
MFLTSNKHIYYVTVQGTEISRHSEPRHVAGGDRDRVSAWYHTRQFKVPSYQDEHSGHSPPK